MSEQRRSQEEYILAVVAKNSIFVVANIWLAVGIVSALNGAFLVTAGCYGLSIGCYLNYQAYEEHGVARRLVSKIVEPDYQPLNEREDRGVDA